MNVQACIFCKIVAGEIPAKVIFEDDHTLALLDAFPLVEGHTLVVPKAHFEHLKDMPVEQTHAWAAAVQRTAGQVQAALDAPAMTIGLNDGKAAGQVVPHVHMHLIPRFAGDGGGTLHSVVKQEDQRGLDEVYEQLKTVA